MSFKDLIIISFRAISSNGLRSLLTTLGIIIGVSSVIILMAIGQGAVKGVIDELSSLGTNLIFIEPGSSDEGGQKGAAGSAITLTREDGEALMEAEISGISNITSMIDFDAKAITSSNNVGVQVVGTEMMYSLIRGLDMEEGRFIDESDVVSVLVDISKGFDNQDKNIIRHVIDKGKGLIIIINKWDLVDEKETNTMRNLKEDIIYDYPNIKHFPIKFISIKNNFRVGEVLRNMLDVYNKRKSKISTSKLNVILESIIRYYSPPSVKGKEIKLKYITQVSTQPPLFVIFTNHPDLIPESYKRYVENKVREECDFFGVPILFSYRKK